MATLKLRNLNTATEKSSAKHQFICMWCIKSCD